MKVIKIGKTFWAGFFKAVVHFILKKIGLGNEISRSPSMISHIKIVLFSFIESGNNRFGPLELSSTNITTKPNEQSKK